MAWITLTDEHLKTRLSGAELTAFSSAALAEGQSDPTDDILGDVTNEVRGFVAGNRNNTLGAAGTIPDKLRSAALDIATLKICQRAAGIVIDPGGHRAEAAKQAYRLLAQVADGKFAVEEPETATDEVIGAPSPSIAGRDREHKRSDQDGL